MKYWLIKKGNILNNDGVVIAIIPTDEIMISNEKPKFSLLFDNYDYGDLCVPATKEQYLDYLYSKFSDFNKVEADVEVANILWQYTISKTLKQTAGFNFKLLDAVMVKKSVLGSNALKEEAQETNWDTLSDANITVLAFIHYHLVNETDINLSIVAQDYLAFRHILEEVSNEGNKNLMKLIDEKVEELKAKDIL